MQIIINHENATNYKRVTSNYKSLHKNFQNAII